MAPVLPVEPPMFPAFDGATFEQQHDGARLSRQLDSVRRLMADGRPRTLREIAEQLQIPESSASARLRDLRKAKFGGLVVDRQRRGDAERGIFEYKIHL